ncbi:hypothetical protein QCD60_15710 [Pokkaliibacter sp. MBI-7]|uniref:hypothetical protein n=1 Tax=Pokkaliibacter sp. MBI-7 TaxID=3040600 RepID=UPI002446AA2A|nr:hypothetical protein [Pokkaliibacter sp. MBI-7]MDH2434013.1 hypothetical protein [Pokkaliibacter sp. MBI-7]
MAVGFVLHRPHPFAVGRRHFLRGAEVVEVVVVHLREVALPFELGQRAVGARFVEVAAVVAEVVGFGDQPVGLPDEGGEVAADVFADAPAKGVVAVAHGAEVGQGDLAQPVLAVVLVAGDEAVPGAAVFGDEVAKAVVFEAAVALYGEAVAGGAVAVGAGVGVGGVALVEQVARRVVVELFFEGAAHGFEPVEGVVVVMQGAFVAVVEGDEVAHGVVLVAPLVDRPALAGAMALLFGQAALFVVLPGAGEGALPAADFLPVFVGMAGQGFIVEVDAAELAVGAVVVVQAVAVGQFEGAEAAEVVVAVAQGVALLVFGDQAAIEVVGVAGDGAAFVLPQGLPLY